MRMRIIKGLGMRSGTLARLIVALRRKSIVRREVRGGRKTSGFDV